MNDRSPRCLFNTHKNCSDLCLLRENANDLTQRLAKAKNITFEEVVEMILHYDNAESEIYRLLNKVWADSIASLGYDTYCYNGENETT